MSYFDEIPETKKDKLKMMLSLVGKYSSDSFEVLQAIVDESDYTLQKYNYASIRDEHPCLLSFAMIAIGSTCRTFRYVAGVNNSNYQTTHGVTVLHLAVYKGDVAAAESLLQYYDADVHLATHGGMMPIHIAQESGNEEMIKLLVSYGAQENMADLFDEKKIAISQIEEVATRVEDLRMALRLSGWLFEKTN